MTNIWAQTFEEIRKPHFEMEDPYTLSEKKASKDYDGDGKLESGAKEHAGAVHNAIQRKKGGKPDGQDTSSVKEETLVEVEKKTSADKKVDVMKGGKNKVVINPAIREEVEAWVSELVEEGYDLSEFTWEEMTEIYEAVELDEGHGSRTSFKKQSADERWRVKSFGSNYTPHKNYDPQANRGQGQILRPKQAEKQRRKSLAKSAVGEEYELEEGTAGMPAAGDAERVSVTNPQIASAKRRAAQTQIAADMARIKLQRASAANESYDSIVEYLSQRNDAFENLEEGVFDPKKSKLRPASERSQRTMTPQQRSAAKKAAARTAEIHSKGETVLQGLRPQGQRGKVKTTPDAKPAAPAANRTVKGRYDKLAKAATSVLKSAQK